MSATNFYQTFYQTDQLFRLVGEPWSTVKTATDTQLIEVTAPADTAPVAINARSDAHFLTELDRLATPLEEVESGNIEAVDEPTPVLVEAAPEPDLTVVPATPQPLPQPAPRPTTPSLLPPIQQQSRLPQLNHKVLLLADEELDPSNLLFLEKILKAVNLNVNGVDLLNLRGAQNVDFDELLKGKYINHFITFGVPFERINLDIMMDRYAPVRFEGITFLMADSLPTIEADQNLKKRLWAALQRVFLQRYA
ncbi:hypothetical protein [Spirosoma arcticum]